MVENTTLTHADLPNCNRPDLVPACMLAFLRGALEVHVWLHRKIKGRHVVEAYVPISSIKLCPKNPKGRINPDSPHIRKLVRSLTVCGNHSTVIVTPDGMLIEGHCRLTSEQVRGEKYITVIVTMEDPATLYVHINEAIKKHTGNQNLERFLKGDEWVSEFIASGWRNAENWLANGEEKVKGLGKKKAKAFLRTLQEKGGDKHTFNIARQTMGYCKLETPKKVVECALWMTTLKQREEARKYMALNLKSSLITDAIFHETKLVPIKVLGLLVNNPEYKNV